MRDSFVFYRSFYEAIRELPRDVQGEIYTAIMEYSLYGRETENLKPIARSVFVLIKPTLDANNARYLNAKKGGAPKGRCNNPNGRGGNTQEQTENKPKTNQEQTENITYVDVDVDVDVVKKEKENEKEKKQRDQLVAKQKNEENLNRIENAFRFNAAAFASTYPQEMIEDFCNYWLEKNKSGTKFRFQLEKTWDLSKRLSRWAKNGTKFQPRQQAHRGTTLEELGNMITMQNGTMPYLPQGMLE